MVSHPKADTEEVAVQEDRRPSAGQSCFGHVQMLFTTAAEEAKAGPDIEKVGWTGKRELRQRKAKAAGGRVIDCTPRQLLYSIVLAVYCPCTACSSQTRGFGNII